VGIRVRAGKHTTMGAGTYVVLVLLAIFGIAGAIYAYWPEILATGVVALVIWGVVKQNQRPKATPSTATWAETAAAVAAASPAKRAEVRRMNPLTEGTGWHWDAADLLVRDSSTGKISGHSWE
jgi:hypothetical protein